MEVFRFAVAPRLHSNRLYNLIREWTVGGSFYQATSRDVPLQRERQKHVQTTEWLAIREQEDAHLEKGEGAKKPDETKGETQLKEKETFVHARHKDEERKRYLWMKQIPKEMCF